MSVLGVPDDERGDVFDAGCSTAEAGTGFGRRVVERLADANGWNVRVTDGATAAHASRSPASSSSPGRPDTHASVPG